jgi:mono/diheme cytochrome c family protein
MAPTVKGALITVGLLLGAGVLGTVMFVKATGLSARAEPGAVETAIARRLRTMAVPSAYADLRNPVLMNEESVRNGMAHFADHCAQCHANDGTGAAIGKDMFPPTPDLRASTTQSLGDGELFYILEHGVRFTGMPAFATDTLDGEESSWHLVNFIRHLPKLTEAELEEMAAMNPRPPAEVRQEIEEQRFLAGEEAATASERPSSPPSQPHGRRTEDR